MKVKHYEIKISWSDEDHCFIARVPELPGCMTDGETEEEALRNAKEAICSYLEALKSEGKAIPPSISSKSFSGTFPIRITPELHRSLAITAALEKISLNKLIVKIVSENIVSVSESGNIRTIVNMTSDAKATNTKIQKTSRVDLMHTSERKQRRKTQSA
ncbi:MAG: type II toxin-antitoxin system HicB family antitoxin [Bdellovibrionia bacterium]